MFDQPKVVTARTLVASHIIAKKIQAEAFGAQDRLEPTEWKIPEKLQMIRDLDQAELRPTLLNNHDFRNGTYRITRPGLYILKENIVFDPAPERNHWPDFSVYPKSKYQLGFFAAITVESPNVVIEGNNHKISQSPGHYLNQRFFACIELADQPFLPKQGPASLGENISATSSCRIQNLCLGRSSHHGIHGNNNKNLVISNVTVSDFEVAGIALNGCSNVYLENVLVTSSLTDLPVMATYSHARFMDPFWDKVDLEKSVVLNGVNIKGKEIHDTLKENVRQAYQEYVTTKEVTNEIFANDTAIPDGNQYGILFNLSGVAVHGLLDSRESKTNGNNNIFLENVSVSGLACKFHEVLGLRTDKLSGYSKIQTGVTGAVFRWFPEDGTQKYKRNFLADAFIFLASQGFGNLSKNTLDWAAGKEDLDVRYTDENNDSGFVLNIDSMAHTAKGSIGVFINGAKNLHTYKLSVYRISNSGDPQRAEKSRKDLRGNDVCGIVVAASEKVNLCDTTVSGLQSSNGKTVGIFEYKSKSGVRAKGTTVSDLQGKDVFRDLKVN